MERHGAARQDDIKQYSTARSCLVSPPFIVPTSCRYLPHSSTFPHARAFLGNPLCLCILPTLTFSYLSSFPTISRLFIKRKTLFLLSHYSVLKLSHHFSLRSSSPLSGTITCMFVVSAAIGEMIIPLIVGKVFDYIGPISFLAEGCILCFVAIGTYLAVMIMGKSLSLQRGKCCNPPT